MSRTIEEIVSELGLSESRYEAAVDAMGDRRRRQVRLWSYYANPMRGAGQVTDRSERPYRQAQEWGMPARITGYWPGYDPLHDGAIVDTERKEVIVENDIAWRIDTQVDYLFGRMPQIRSLAGDEPKRKDIEQLLKLIIDNSGGIRLLQQIALLGAVYGWVDVAVTLDTGSLRQDETLKRASGSITAGSTGDTLEDGARADGTMGEEVPEREWPMLEMARLVSLQVIEPARTLLLTDPRDAMRLVGYGQMYEMAGERKGSVAGMFRRLLSGSQGEESREQVLELWTDRGWWKWRNGELESSGGNSLGVIPVVHVQNTAVPFAYSGASDVEALLPLQDELNTRLSDRAHRIAMQSFKMYLGIGVDLKAEPPSPSRVWNGNGENPDVKEIGGAASCPAEDLHIAEVREAMDKASGVPPVAAGAIRNRIGNLTSAAALRVTLMSLLARTERKRALYGEGLKGMCELALRWLDAAGVFATDEQDRQVDVIWPDPLPESSAEKLQIAKAKLELGMGREEVMRGISAE